MHLTFRRSSNTINPKELPGNVRSLQSYSQIAEDDKARFVIIRVIVLFVLMDESSAAQNVGVKVDKQLNLWLTDWDGSNE